MPQIFNGKVRDLSHKGLGVVDHPDGRIFFVRGTWPGDEGQFQISDDAKKYDEALLLKLLTPSSERVPVACKYRGFEPGMCGGCPWMIANYSSQLKYKTSRLLHAMSKRGLNLEQSILQTIIPAPRQLAYRNRVQLKSNGERLGFVSEGSSVFAPVDDCLIMNEKVNTLFHSIQRSLPCEEFKPTGNYQWTFVDLDEDMSPQEVVVNRRRPFRQGNSEQNEAMKAWLREKLLPIPSHYPVVDLFCGSGNFTEVLHQMNFSNLLAVEVQGSALETLRKKNLNGVRILPLDMTSKGAWAQVSRNQPHAKVIIIDPPREGLEKRKGMYKYLDNLQVMIYISCELDTFSRDAVDIIKNGWILKELTPIDLFPHTPHVEILSVFERP
jgi:23S rRNA (uracil1939-C5)-methyltransferase